MKLRNAEEKLAALQIKVDSGVVLAPVLGVVLKPVGESDSKKTDIVGRFPPSPRGSPLAAVGDLAGLRVVSKVDEVDVGKLLPGPEGRGDGRRPSGPDLRGPDQRNFVHRDFRLQGRPPPAFDVQTTIEDLPPDVASHIRLGMSANLQVQVL